MGAAPAGPRATAAEYHRAAGLEAEELQKEQRARQWNRFHQKQIAFNNGFIFKCEEGHSEEEGRKGRIIFMVSRVALRVFGECGGHCVTDADHQ